MEAVYTLLNVDRGVPEVFGSTYDIRSLLAAAARLSDGEGVNVGPGFVQRAIERRIADSEISELIEQFKVFGDRKPHLPGRGR